MSNTKKPIDVREIAARNPKVDPKTVAEYSKLVTKRQGDSYAIAPSLGTMPKASDRAAYKRS